MKKIPRDIDDLMWMLSEKNDVRAQEEFSQRYPDYRGELQKRISLVKQFKSANISKQEDEIIPRFEPRPEQMHLDYRPQSARWIPVAVSVLLVIVAYASYRITTGIVNRSEPVRYAIQEDDLNKTNPSDRTHLSLPEPDKTTKTGITGSSNAKPNGKAISIKIDRAPLISVIDLIAKESGLQIELAPNMENPDIRLEYSNVSGMSILQDLGKQFGFTALSEGQNKVLLVPAVDPSKANETSTPLGMAELVEDENSPAHK
jgi:hypothetical protein